MFSLKTAQNLQRCIQVEWEDGLLAKFSYVWLRDNTRRRPSLVHLDLNAKPEEVKCCKEALEVQWPPFISSRYSSNFLRDNAIYQPIRKTTNPLANFKNKSKLAKLSGKLNSTMQQDVLNGNLLAVGYAGMPIDERQLLGKCHSTESAQEPGTIWPHLCRIPQICAIDTLTERPANLSFVDVEKALNTLRERYPKAFSFLGNCVLEYKEGPFCSTHPIIRVDEQQGTLTSGIFNNAARSSAITVESLDDLYESLQKFGRICAENAHAIRLMPGQRLFFDNTRVLLGMPAQSGRHLVISCFK